jgi:hypothetical protein
MSENPNIKNNTVNMEAPASWNTRYVTPDGFVCQLTLRGETGKDLLEKANAALTWLRENGYLPSEFNGYRSRNNGNKSENNAQPSNGNGNGNGKQDHPENICPIHQCEMKRWEKNGKIWYSHKTDDGWCTGKSK